MKKLMLITLLTFSAAGCATLTGPGGVLQRPALELKLSKAVALQKQGETSAAAGLLAEICADSPSPGITDEAMFRLSLIRLVSDGEWGDVAQARKDLKLLTTYYPASSWAPLAASVTAFLETLKDMEKLDEVNSALELQGGVLKETNLALTKRIQTLKEDNLALKKELGALKGSNHALTQENRELRETIEKLKALELELRAVPRH